MTLSATIESWIKEIIIGFSVILYSKKSGLIKNHIWLCTYGVAVASENFKTVYSAFTIDKHAC